MHFSRTFTITLATAFGPVLVASTFPSEPMAAVNITDLIENMSESNSTGVSEDCNAILVSPEDGVKCGTKGVITQNGIVAINMWPNQPQQVSAGACAIYCNNRVGGLYRSFGLHSSTRNVTVGYACECYDSGVGGLKLSGGDVPWTFYDSKCFLLEC